MPESPPDFNHNQPVYSVSEVSQSIKRTVEDHFGTVRIRGEISGFKLHSSGHAYFSMKDENACIDSVCWRGNVGRLKFKAEDGLEVIATGKITTYPGRSKYQIVVDHMEPAGVGALMALLEKRRKMFEAEGLFDPKRKKPLPFLPQTIGVITSPTGAVIRDILHRISDRFPVHVIVWPVPVQGEGAAEKIAEAIRGFNNMLPAFSAENAMERGSRLTRPAGLVQPDLLIVARGGGSIEDLWAFNEEIVVRAAAESKIPLISAVGHETDTTLIDYVSDRRAPTPTASAEMAVPVREELWLGIKQLDARLSSALQRNFAQKKDILEGLARGLPKPSQLLQTATQRLDDWSERLLAALPASLSRKEQQLALLAAHLKPQVLFTDIKKTAERLQELHARQHTAINRQLSHLTEKLHQWEARLESVNYQRVLERGFAIVKDASGKLITSVAAAKSQASLIVTFKDGDVKVKP